MTNDYHTVTCPGCNKQLVIRLHHNETPATPCQCKRTACTVEWGMRTVTVNGQSAQVYAPELIAKKEQHEETLATPSRFAQLSAVSAMWQMVVAPRLDRGLAQSRRSRRNLPNLLPRTLWKQP